MGNGNGYQSRTIPGTVAVGMVPKLQKPNHREDYVLRVVPPNAKYPEPKVELKVYVDNRTEKSPYQGISSKGGYFLMTLAQFDALIALRPKVAEAIKALVAEGVGTSDSSEVPAAPSLDILSGVTG